MTVAPPPSPLAEIGLRYGVPADLDRLAAMHARCSEQARHRRFHTPLPVVPERLAARILEPADGWSVVVEHGPDLVAVATTGPVSTTDLEVGVLVEDAHQGRGIGTLLLREVAGEAAWRGYRTLLCLTQPDNEAVLRSIAKAGLPSRASSYDGVMSVVMDLSPGAGLARPA